jgi:hypothetical protein
MNKVNRVVVQEQEERIPQLQVVAASNDASQRNKLSAPLFMPSHLHQRTPRRELAAMGWDPRALRLASAK